MVKRIINGIAMAIRKQYPERDYLIKTETSEQDFITPCFFIKFITQVQQPKLSNHYKEVYTLDVQFYAKNGRNDDCMDVSAELCDVLEYITVGTDLVRGSNINIKIEDGVLHFLIDYAMSVYRPLPVGSNMKEVVINEKITG